MTLTLSKSHLAIGLVIFLAIAGLGFYLWLQAHDASVKLDSTISQNASDIKAAQQQAQELQKSIQQRDAQAQQDQQARDKLFASLDTLTKQVAMMAQLAGMKSQPIVVQPGQIPQLPQGGTALTPQQQQDLTNYEHACEDCKADRTKLSGDLSDTRAQLAAAQVINSKQKQDLDAALKVTKKGLRYRLEECAERAAVGATSGAVGAAMSTAGPLQGKPVGRAAGVGAAIGAASCLIFKR